MKVLPRCLITLSTLLAACGQQAPNQPGAAGNTVESPNNASNPASAIKAKATGTVTAIDKAAGTITLNHGPIPEAKWPAMTMAFKAQPELLDRVKVGDKVAFDLTLTGGAGEVTGIQRR